MDYLSDNWFKFIVVFLLIFISLRAAQADIYTWTDPYGVTHFTDNANNVPRKYPLKVFVFTKEHKWTEDRSTHISDRVDQLREFNKPAIRIWPRENYLDNRPIPRIWPDDDYVAPQCRREKRHRSHRKH